MLLLSFVNPNSGNFVYCITYLWQAWSTWTVVLALVVYIFFFLCGSTQVWFLWVWLNVKLRYLVMLLPPLVSMNFTKESFFFYFFIFKFSVKVKIKSRQCIYAPIFPLFIWFWWAFYFFCGWNFWVKFNRILEFNALVLHWIHSVS